MRALIVGIVLVALCVTVGCKRASAPPPVPSVQAAPAAPSGGSVAELPEYPGAARVAYSEKGPADDYARRVEASFTSTDALQSVRAFYQNAIANGGWTVVELKEEHDEVEWKLAKGMATAEIEVEVKAPGTVSIRLLRKDR